MKLASTFLYVLLIRFISDMRLDIKVGTYQEGKVCRKLLTFQQVLWILDRPIGHVGGNVLAGGRGKPPAHWHLCHLSALLKADQCVSRGKSNNRRLVTTSQRGSRVQPVALLIDARQLMPARPTQSKSDRRHCPWIWSPGWIIWLVS